MIIQGVVAIGFGFVMLVIALPFYSEPLLPNSLAVALLVFGGATIVIGILYIANGLRERNR